MPKTGLKNSLSFKLFVVGFLVALLMIPTGMIAVLVNERENRQQDAIWEVSEKWGLEQTITGPILSVPYKKTTDSQIEGQAPQELVRYAHFLPEELKIDGEIKPETRKRGIYEVVLYSSELRLSGSFNSPDLSAWEIAREDIMLDKAVISLGIPDMRGVKEGISITWNGREYAFSPGLPVNDVLASGVSASIDLAGPDNGQVFDFTLELVLNGSQDLMFTPVGKVTEARLSSSWPDPSFQGAFLPAEHTITNQGFSADWKVLELNRSFPQSFLGAMRLESSNPDLPVRYLKETSRNNGLNGANFGVRLLIPADEYQNTVRALKYSIMILSLTFLVLFFFEAMRKSQVHPLQYILIGLALSLFYVLLLSIAEYLGFNAAYLISGLSIIGLITLYSKSVFKAWKPALIESLVLLFVYGFVFVILQLEDLSLLIGSIGLFIILSIVMFVSRNIDWSNINGATGGN